ncbi:hypothetical protein [Chenggangzhangella methanolivorans]|uniref:Uncharacterized protein n=1 Tax=Chenggangzhangella methanolivorans TaxID=1437009 RepID=A0A9E6UNI0_9HYPH|nr:hypothetical protein [Chenggangzhangella methanolivorans]QZN98549.1 hypothetical protein K6K41_16055 [Chenggangzhangella methanolivorans]
MIERLNVSDIGRRWGAVWAQRAIVEAVKSDGALPSKANASMASDFNTRVAELREAGVGQEGVAAFTAAATKEMDRRLSLATRAIEIGER